MSKEKQVRRHIFVLVLMCTAILSGGGMALAATLNGTNGDDTINGTSEADTISALDGNDLARGYAGDDTIEGGDGADELYGGNQDLSSSGDDVVKGQSGPDGVAGGPGADMLIGGLGDDTLLEGPIDDSAIDRLYGGDGDDQIKAASSSASADVIDCGGGVDTVEVDSVDQVDANCENVRIMQIEEVDTSDPDANPDSGYEFSAGPVYYECKIPAYGNYKCGPAFDMPKGWRLFVNQKGSSPIRTVTSYAAFNYTSSGCNGAQLTRWRYASNGDTVFLGRIGLDYDYICVRANVRALKERTVWGYYKRRS